MRHKSRWWIMAGFSRARTAALLILLYLVVQTSDASYTSEKEDPMPHTKNTEKASASRKPVITTSKTHKSFRQESWSQSGDQMPGQGAPPPVVEQWATKMGYYIYALANEVSKYSEISNEFQKEGASITTTDGLKMVKEMAGDVTNMLNFKIEAVKRIMNVAEEASLDPDYRKDTPFEYYNAKKLNSYYVSDKHEKNGQLKEGFREILLYNNSHFDSIPVNLSASSVHVPTNVYDGAPDVIQAIRWSEALDRTFISNYGLDPTLSWQYFASSTGFLRQYPAAKWVQDDRDPDLYDARLRSWYIQAANSPKDMVILLDVSGSMTGLRREIAKHVVLNILDTLNENDFVNVFNFSKDTTALVPCFNDTLVQATLENVGEFKSALSNITTKDIANFTQALTKAFKLLEKYRESGHGSQCNQAIMLVSDGAPYKYVELFRKHNMPQFQVRIFTYLIGREVTDKDALKWMACANKGYFVHVTTLAEVREQVLKYIPVIARPMIMYQNNHPEIWTGVYADIADPKQTDWLWELRERKRQMDRTNNYRKLKSISVEKKSLADIEWLQNERRVETFLEYGISTLTERDIAKLQAEQARRTRLPHRNKRQVYLIWPRRITMRRLKTRFERIYNEMDKLEQWYNFMGAGRRESPGSYEGYRLMTTVAVPVFDRNTYENITERVMVNGSEWIEKVRKERVANLLGVAGTDVPIREIEKLIPPYKLGVNGYRFMVNKNGHILFHPDLRPVHEEANAEFQDILKPNYNSVDLNEVELIDDIEDPRFNHSVLLEYTSKSDNKLRTDMIDQRTSELELNVRIHMDNMKRVVTREQTYFTKAVGDTPFSLGIAMPKGYGKYRVVGQIEISREMRETTGLNASDFFTSGNWRLHPDWVYCEYKYDQYDLQGSRPTIEQEMMNFIVRAQSPGWKWRSSRTRPPPERNMKTAQSRSRPASTEDDKRNSYYCDKELVQSLLFDAKVTNVYDIKPKIEKDTLNRGRHKSSGVTTAFVATRSGLTRWVDFVPHNEDEPHFMETNNRAIDEVWYRRAVDYYEQDNASFIYSVPFDAATRDPDKVIVTATRAIFVATNAQQKAPAAVVGINIKHDKFVEFFRNHTYTCPSYAARDTCIRSKTCKNEFLDCYLLDDNGYVVVSEKFTDTGKFFGEIEGTIMESLVQSELYKRVKVYDYQAVCLQPKKKGSGASSLPTPMQALQWTANWIMGKIFWVLLKTNLYFLWDANSAWAFTQRSVDQSIPDIEPPIPDIPDYKDTPFEEIKPTDEDYMHQPVDGGEFPSLQMAYINKTRPKRCDKEVDLYMLQTAKLLDTKGNYRAVKGKLSNCHANGCARPFSVQKVQNTNLILIAVDNLCPCPSSKVDVNPREVEYNETQHCERLLTNNFRRRPKYCCNYHSEEDQIKDCGGCGGLTFQPLLLLALLVVEYSLNHLRLRS